MYYQFSQTVIRTFASLIFCLSGDLRARILCRANIKGFLHQDFLRKQLVGMVKEVMDIGSPIFHIKNITERNVRRYSTVNVHLCLILHGNRGNIVIVCF